jgi:hypothetical protein
MRYYQTSRIGVLGIFPLMVDKNILERKKRRRIKNKRSQK